MIERLRGDVQAGLTQGMCEASADPVAGDRAAEFLRDRETEPGVGDVSCFGHRMAVCLCLDQERRAGPAPSATDGQKLRAMFQAHQRPAVVRRGSAFARFGHVA